MKALGAACLMLAVLCGAARADAPAFDFQAPAAAADPATAAAIRDLAVRLIPVYQDPDSDRYLANLSALQMAAGDYSSADVTRQTLRDRRRRAELNRPVGRAVIFDIYAYAKAIESENRVSFAQGFTRAYHEVVRRMDDHDASVVNAWFELPPTEFRYSLQGLLDQDRARDSVSEAEALQLVWAYVSFEAYRQFMPLVAGLAAEEHQRRYVADAAVTLQRRGGGTLTVTVIRSRSLSKPGPALLEFTPDDATDHARESAAHGYAGVVVYAPPPRDGERRAAPFESAAADARTVIDWITRQRFSDGRVGMTGDGAGGFVAWAAARTAPAALKAIATSAPTAPGVDFPMTGGIFANAAFRWSLAATTPADSPLASTLSDDAAWRAFDRQWYLSGSRYRDLGRLFGTPNPVFLRWLNHPSYDRYWQRLIPFESQFAGIKIPILTVTGYFSASEPGALYYFAEQLRHNPHADHTLVIGPYDDAGLARGRSPTVPGAGADVAANLDLRELHYQWFDHVFKAAALPATLQDRVNYELAGANDWRHAPSLEALEKDARRYYLASGAAGGAPSLSTHPPARAQFTRQTLSFTDRSDVDWVPSTPLKAKAPDLHDAIAFTSAPFTQAADVAGLFSGRLDFTVNKMDLDVELSLYEQTAGGEFVRLFGPAYAFRASYVRDRVHRHLLAAGTREALSFRSERFAGRRLAAGSRLVLTIGLTKRPDREINYGTGNDVSEESVAEGAVPLKVDWYDDSYIDVPAGPAVR